MHKWEPVFEVMCLKDQCGEKHKLKSPLNMPEDTCCFWTADTLCLVTAGQIQKNMKDRRDFPRLLMFFKDFCPGSLYQYTLNS